MSTVTFLFTDLEDSTPLWEKHPELMQELSSLHDGLIRRSVEANQGRVVKSTGDGFHAVFESATDAAAAALEAQSAICRQPWPAETGPLRVRMGLHTGESRYREGDYYGPEVNRAARVMGIAHGGQILLSEAAGALVRKSLPEQVTLSDLGRHRLRGIAADEQIFQLMHPALPAQFPPLKSLSAYKHNLGVQLSTFVGREKELKDIRRLLYGTHLLTLLGPGGTGKTRLMLQAAEDLIEDFADGVWLVELAPLTDAALIPERVATALSVHEQPGRPLVDSVADFLRQKELLLLLDNVEHLLRDSAVLAETLLTRCPRLKILVTGREALFIRGEVTLQIPSLSLPSEGERHNLKQVRASEGVQLFLDRAQEIRPDFELAQANMEAIVEIVRRLDGIPFALELAAARLRFLSVEQIADRLHDRFRLLTGGRRTALPRQQTLQAMIDWSWNLLDEKERLLLQRLSVFSGGWSLEAAQVVASDELLDEYDIFDGLEQLVNKSLVTVRNLEGGDARYGALESIRQYGRDRLLESGEGETVRARHAEYYVAFSDEAAPHLFRASMIRMIDRITLEMDNLRAVMAWTIEDRPELALRICANLLYHEVHWISLREAQSWLEPAIEKTRPLLGGDEPVIRMADFVRASIGLGSQLAMQGRRDLSFPRFDEAIALARREGEERLVAFGIGAKYAQEIHSMTPEGRRELEDAIAISRRRGYEAELLWVAGVYGVALAIQGDAELAKPYLKEVIEISGKGINPFDAGMFGLLASVIDFRDDVGEARDSILTTLRNFKALKYPRGVAMSQSALAHILRRNGELEEAEHYYRQSIAAWQEIGQLPAVAHQLECFAFIAIARGQFERAALLLGAATEIRGQLNSPSTDPVEIEELAQGMNSLAEAIGERERDKLMAQGGDISIEDAVLLALTEEL